MAATSPEGSTPEVPDAEPLVARLDAYARSVRAAMPSLAAAADRLIARLEAAGSGAHAPAVGEPLPPFILPDESGRLVALEDLTGRGPLIVLFRRGHWCSYCRLATQSLTAVEAGARARGASIVAITPERSPYSRRFKDAVGASFPVLTDIDNGYALSLGLAISVGAELAGEMAAHGQDLAIYQGSQAWMLPIPATFVLDRNGIIIARHVDPNYRRRIEARELLAELDAHISV